MQNKTPKNENGFAHGYSEVYYSNGNLTHKGSYLNGERHGPWEGYWKNGNLMHKGSYINGAKIGFWIWGCSDGLIEEISFYAK